MFVFSKLRVVSKRRGGGIAVPDQGWAFWAALLLLGVSAPTLRAQEPAPLKLTLHEAVTLALRQNPEVQIGILNLAESVQDANIARADLLPQADLDVSDAAMRGNVEAAFGQRFPGLPEHYGPFQIFAAGPQFSTPIFDLSLWRKWQAAKSSEQASDADRVSIREQVTLLVVSQYLLCLRSAADVRAGQSRVDLAQALYDQAEDLQKHGAGTGLDTLRANVELQNEKQVLLVAQTEEKTSLYGLARLLNLDPHQSVELEDAMSFFETPNLNLQESMDASVAARPEMLALNARQKALEDEKKAVSDSRLPSARFVGSWDYLGISTSTGIPAYNYAVEFDVPVFTGGRIHAENTRADLGIDQDRAPARRPERPDRARGQDGRGGSRTSARNEVDVANQGVSLAQEEVQQARDRFAGGRREQHRSRFRAGRSRSRQRQSNRRAVSLQPGARGPGARQRADGISCMQSEGKHTNMATLELDQNLRLRRLLRRRKRLRGQTAGGKRLFSAAALCCWCW